MCEFLKGPNHKDVKKIAELEYYLSSERHACDALFASLANNKVSEAMDLYSRVILARSTGDYENIIDSCHKITGETQ